MALRPRLSSGLPLSWLYQVTSEGTRMRHPNGWGRTRGMLRDLEGQ